MIRFLSVCIDRVMVVAGALLCAQAPQFFQAYTQRLAGHTDELRLQVRALQVIASGTGKTLDQYIAKFVLHADPDFAGQGVFMQGLVDRFQVISGAYQSMIEASPLTRPFQFVHHLQWDIAHATVRDFTPGLSFSVETAIYAVVGMSLGYGLFFVSRAVLRLGMRKFLPSSFS